MPGGRFSKKDDRQAKHVADSMKKRGMSPKKAKSVGYATVVKQKGKKKSSPDSKARNLTSKTKPKRKPANRRTRNKGRS